jgi:hypothetical protein
METRRVWDINSGVTVHELSGERVWISNASIPQEKLYLVIADLIDITDLLNGNHSRLPQTTKLNLEKESAKYEAEALFKKDQEQK